MSVAVIDGVVVAVHRTARHQFSKETCAEINLLAGLGVEGDAHCGALVRHRYLVRRDATRPNLTQVHLLEEERLAELRQLGFAIDPGQLGENITTRGLDLRAMPLGTRLRIGDAVVELTGLRTPCVQMDRFQAGLMAASLGRDAKGSVMPKAGVMGTVREGGTVAAGQAIGVDFPDGELCQLGPV